MPKVGKEKITIDTEPPELFEVEVTFSRSQGTFYIKLPDGAETVMTDEEQKASHYSVKSGVMPGEQMMNYFAEATTYDDAIKRFEEIVKRFRATAVVERKVIVYTVNYNDADEIDNQDHRWGMSVPMLQFDFRVLWERTLGNKVIFCKNSQAQVNATKNEKDSWKRLSADEEHNFKHDAVIEWTQEREEGLKAFRNALVTLVRNVHMFFGQEGEHLMKHLDNGQRLLNS